MRLARAAWIALSLTGCYPEVPIQLHQDTGHEGGGGAGGAGVCAGSLDLQDRCTFGGECGRCIVAKPSLKEALALWHIGPPGQDFACPAGAPHAGSILYGDLPQAAPAVCPQCECGPAKCAMPPEVVASPGKCVEDEPGVLYSSGVWEESTCTTDGSIPATKEACGGDWCESLTFPPAIVEPCAPITLGAPVLPSWEFGLVARECIVEPLTREDCPKAGQACIPPAPGFSICVAREGHDPEYPCDAPYPRRLELFAGVHDGRGCDPCDCGEPEGAKCAAVLYAFPNAACEPDPIGAVVVDDDEGACVDILGGSPMGSKAGHFMVDEPGQCATIGGAPVGVVKPAGAWTLCCEAEPEPTE